MSMPLIEHRSIELVSHCWNYARPLAYQLSSLVLFPPEGVEITVTIWHSECDARTVEVLEFFGRREIPNVTWNWRSLAPPRLCRRSIGRNISAQENQSDWVWFADCDMCFRGCFTEETMALWEKNRERSLIYPRRVNVSKSSLRGDSTIEAMTEIAVRDIDPEDFIPRKYRRAIGGVQIVRGDVLREIGYANSRRGQRPVKKWRRTFEDTSFRRSLKTPGRAIQFPGVYRIRHSQNGRTVKGLKL